MSTPLVLSLLIFLLSAVCFADDQPVIGTYCGDPFTGAAMQNNINAVLKDLVAKASVGGFATSSRGRNGTTIYGLAQCRGDVDESDCVACLNDAAAQLPQACPQQADARVWYDYCFMRYDDNDFIGQSDTSYAVVLINVQQAADPKKFEQATSKVMTKADASAVAPGNGFLGRATAPFTPYITIYGLGWCTKDISPLLCAQCLSTGVAQFPIYCGAQQGCRVLYSSCTVRYEIYPFFFPIDKAAAAAKAKADSVAASDYIKIIVRH